MSVVSSSDQAPLVTPTSTPPTSAPPARSPAARSFVWHAKLIGALTFVSRILGMARESVAANYFGAGAVWSAFTVAFTIPNLFRKLFGEGALSAAFIPLYAQAVKEEGQGLGFRVQGSAEEEGTEARRHEGTKGSVQSPGDAHLSPSPGTPGEGWGEGPIRNPKSKIQNGTNPQSATRLSSSKSLRNPQSLNPEPRTLNPLSATDFAIASVNLLCVILIALTLIGELILLALPHLWTLRPDYLLAVKLTAIMLPYVLLVCGTAFLGAILQVHHRFAAITATSIVLNICLIVAIVAASWMFDLHTPAGQESGVRWLSAAVLIAGVVQVLMLVPSLRAVGFRFRPVLHFWTPQVRRMLKLTVPVALGAGVLQLGVMLDKGIALLLAAGDGQTHFALLGHLIRYPMTEGAAARLNWAQFMYQFPLGVFAIALATAIFPKLSTDALDGDRKQFRSILRQGIEASLFIGLPASIGMIVVRYPAVRLLFERGQFTYQDTQWVALSTAIYSAAIWAFSLQQILNRAYYALHDTVTPLIWTAVNLALNLVVEIPLLWTGLGEAGMAVGTLVSFAIQSVVMLTMLDRRVGGLEMGPTLRRIGAMVVASGLMWLACVGVQYLPIWPTGTGKMVWLAQLMILMLVGAGVYFAVCAALGIKVLQHVLPKRRKLGAA